MSKSIEHEWEIELPASSPDDILTALSARDRVFGQSITLEPEEDESHAVEVWLGTADALEGERFHLAVYADLEGPEEYLEAAVEAVEGVVHELIEAATQDVAGALLLARRPANEIEFRAVEEEDERPQIIIPEWLAPVEELDLPWSFRSFTKDGEAWPDDAILAEHARVAVVPFGDELLLYALPAVPDDDEEEGS